MVVLQGLEIQEQILLHRRNSIRLQVLVIIRVQLSRHTNILGMRDHHMNMCRPIGMPAHDFKQIGRGPRSINSVLRRLQAVEPEFAVRVAAELATEVMAGLVLGVEDIVLAVGASLPHIEDGVGDTFAGFGILDDTVEKCELPVFGHVLDYAAAKVPEWSVRRPEGAKNS